MKGLVLFLANVSYIHGNRHTIQFSDVLFLTPCFVRLEISPGIHHRQFTLFPTGTGRNPALMLPAELI
jgi:hypothetical protein